MGDVYSGSGSYYWDNDDRESLIDNDFLDKINRRGRYSREAKWGENMISLNETLQDLKNTNVSCHHTYVFRKRWSVGDGTYESGDKVWWEEWECSQCGKRHKFPREGADPDKEPESELYPEIAFAHKMIELGNNMIKFIKDKCEHKYKTVEYGSSGGGYEETTYWKKERCAYCDHQRYVDQ